MRYAWRPDVTEVAVTIEMLEFSCGTCRKQIQTRARYIPTDERGEHLYHKFHGPQKDRFGPAWWWCRHCGRLVAGNGTAWPPGSSGNGAGWPSGPKPCDHGIRPTETLTRSCKNCAEAFTPHRSDARYCSNRCRVAAHRTNKAKLQLLTDFDDFAKKVLAEVAEQP